MANEEQLAILKQGVDVWNKWRLENPRAAIDLRKAGLVETILEGANLREADLALANLNKANLSEAILSEADFSEASLNGANLRGANLVNADFRFTDLRMTDFRKANLYGANLWKADLSQANLIESNFSTAEIFATIFANSDLSQALGLEGVVHKGPSTISINTIALSKGKIPEAFLRGCGLSDWETEEIKLYNPDLSNEEINKILYRMYDLRATQAIQISPLFISYSHGDASFVDRVEKQLNKKGIRFWRDIHDMKAGRMETQIDKAISQNRNVLLVLSENSLKSDWVEHEVRMARGLEKEIGRDVLCPVALDDSWKESPWPKRVMEQIMEYNILDFSAWKDDVKFEGMFRKLIDGLELFYKDKSHGE
jgi:hypothetical protein